MSAFNSGSTMIERGSTVIHRSPEAVFRFVGEHFFRNYPRWSPEVCELQQIGSGPVTSGTRARQVRIDLGHRSESIFVVTTFQPGRRVCFEGISSPYRCDYLIEGLSGKSSALVTFTFELSQMEMYLRPFEGLIREAVREGVWRTVRSLKNLLEANEVKRVA